MVDEITRRVAVIRGELNEGADMTFSTHDVCCNGNIGDCLPDDDSRGQAEWSSVDFG